jgi:hypothetical protein
MEDETITLFDTNTISSPGLLPKIFEARTYNEININIVNETINIEAQLIQQMRHEGFMTIESVVDEMVDFQSGIIKNITFLNKRTVGRSDEAEMRMNQLSGLVKQTIKKARESIYKPNFPEPYSSLEALMMYQSRMMHNDAASQTRETSSSNPTIKERHTAEKLATLLLYIPLFENKKAQIISNNTKVLGLSTTLFYTLTHALEKDYRDMALKKLSKFQSSVKNVRHRYERKYPTDDGSYTVLRWFNRINGCMKEDARKIIRMSYGMGR